ncbi:hypothetical protein PN499_23380 [Kamptonema animale CS-326]|nr:hypothetical protein [Kamptonema animale CS-326]
MEKWLNAIASFYTKYGYIATATTFRTFSIAQILSLIASCLLPSA